MSSQDDQGVIGRLREYTSRLGKAAPEPLQVLVVDDEPAVRRFVDRVLRDAGYMTSTAGDGTEAVEVAAKMPKVDVLVTDLMMPKMTGDELARRLRLSVPSLKVLYLTGYADRLFKEKVTLWEGEAFLDKPCSVQGLQEAVSLLAYGHFVAPSRQG